VYTSFLIFYPRFGSCGSINSSRARVGQIAIASEGAIMISRNYDFDFQSSSNFSNKETTLVKPYNISKSILPDALLTANVRAVNILKLKFI
jgi:hypothetical protein